MLPFSNAVLRLFNTSADVGPGFLYIANSPFKDCSLERELVPEVELTFAIVKASNDLKFLLLQYATH